MTRPLSYNEIITSLKESPTSQTMTVELNYHLKRIVTLKTRKFIREAVSCIALLIISGARCLDSKVMRRFWSSDTLRGIFIREWLVLHAQQSKTLPFFPTNFNPMMQFLMAFNRYQNLNAERGFISIQTSNALSLGLLLRGQSKHIVNHIASFLCVTCDPRKIDPSFRFLAITPAEMKQSGISKVLDERIQVYQRHSLRLSKTIGLNHDDALTLHSLIEDQPLLSFYLFPNGANIYGQVLQDSAFACEEVLLRSQYFELTYPDLFGQHAAALSVMDLDGSGLTHLAKLIEYRPEVDLMHHNPANLSTLLSHRVLYESWSYFNQLLRNYPQITVTGLFGAKQQSILMWACSLGKTKSIQSILRHRPNHAAYINLRDKFGRSALHYAAQNCYRKVCRLLEEKGADIYAQDQNGQTPQIYAVRYKREVAMENFAYLRDYKVDSAVPDQKSRTVFQHTREASHAKYPRLFAPGDSKVCAVGDKRKLLAGRPDNGVKRVCRRLDPVQANSRTSLSVSTNQMYRLEIQTPPLRPIQYVGPTFFVKTTQPQEPIQGVTVVPATVLRSIQSSAHIDCS